MLWMRCIKCRGFSLIVTIHLCFVASLDILLSLTMQLLILTLLVAAASATYSYDYSDPHSYGLDSYGSYGGYGGYGGSYGYGNLGSGVSYLLGGHGGSHYTAPSIHFIRYVPSHTAQVSPSGGKINFVTRPLTTNRGTGIKSTHKGSSSTSPQNPPFWLSTKGGTPQSKTPDPSKADGHTKPHGTIDPSKIPSLPKPVIPKTTKVPTYVTPSLPKDIPVTTEFPDDFFNDTIFIEDEPENEIAETPMRPEPMLVENPQSSLVDEDDNSKVKKTFVPIDNNNKDKFNPSSSASTSGKSIPDTDSTHNSSHNSTSIAANIKTGIPSKSSSSKSHTDSAPNSSTKQHTPNKAFVPVPDMDYDDFGTSNKPTNSDDSKKHTRGGFTGDLKTIVPGFSTVHRQTAYNKRPLVVQLMSQAFPVFTSPAIIPRVIVENPVVGYYYENHQPASITYEYGIPVDVVVAN